MVSNRNILTKLGQNIGPHFIFYIGMTMWFHNPDLYEKYGKINETQIFGHLPFFLGNYLIMI